MWPFRKKKIFQITRGYDSLTKYHFTEIVQAVDIAAAWTKIHRRHGIAISLIEWKEIE